MYDMGPEEKFNGGGDLMGWGKMISSPINNDGINIEVGEESYT